MQGYRLNDYESCYAFDIPILSPEQLDAILGVIYTCRYFARSHHKKRINKKWHKRYGIESFGSREEIYFKNHNKRVIYCKKEGL